MFRSLLGWYYYIIRMWHRNEIVEVLTKHPYYTAGVLGSCIGAAFLWSVVLPLAYGALLGVFYVLTKLPKQHSVGFLCTVWGVKSLWTLSFIWTIFPLDWLPMLHESTQLVIIVLYWLTGALWLASAGLVLAWTYRYAARLPNLVRLIAFAVSVVVAEVIAAGFFSIMTAGSGTGVTAAFSFGHVGYLFPWLFPMATYGGVYVVGLVGLIILYTLFDLSMRPRQYIGYCVIGVMTVFYTSTLIQLPEVTVPERVAIVETQFTTVISAADRQLILENLVVEALKTNPAYIVLPEDSRYLTEGYNLDIAGAKDAVAAWGLLHTIATSTILIDSGRTRDSNSGLIVQRGYVWQADTLLAISDKSYLVPQGEYIPSLYLFFIRLFGFGTIANYLTETINYTPGSVAFATTTPNTIPNILFCFESINPLAARTLQQNRPASFVVHPISHSWFHSPYGLWSQLETMLRFQAVAAGVPIVSVGNMMTGKVYTPKGDIQTPRTVFRMELGTVSIVE